MSQYAHRRRLILATGILTALFAGISWQRGWTQGPLTNALNLLVRTDSNGSLYVYGVPVGAQGPLRNLGNTMLRAYAPGALAVTVSGGSITPDVACFSGTTQDSYWAEVAANDLGLYTNGTACASGTLRFDVAATGATLAVPLLVANGTASAPSFALASDATFGSFLSGTGRLTFVRGLNPTRLDLANSYTSSTANELLSVDWQTVANEALVGTRTAGSGSSGRALRLVSQANNNLDQYAFLQLAAPGVGQPFIRMGMLTSAFSNFNITSQGTWIQIGEGTSTATAGSLVRVAILPTYNQLLGSAANTDFLVNRTETNVGSGAQRLLDLQVGSVSKFHVTNAGVVSAGGLTGAGVVGVPVVVGYGNVAAATNTGTASIASYTVGSADGTFEVGCNVLVTASATHSFSCDVTYTDEGNSARTLVIPMEQLDGSFIASGLITNVTGTGPYESPTMTIRAKASTAVTIRTSAGGTFTSVTYNARGIIKQVG